MTLIIPYYHPLAISAPFPFERRLVQPLVWSDLRRERFFRLSACDAQADGLSRTLLYAKVREPSRDRGRFGQQSHLLDQYAMLFYLVNYR